VKTPIGSVFSEMSALVGGVILGLVYFSDLAGRFEPGSAETRAPAGVNLGTHRA